MKYGIWIADAGKRGGWMGFAVPGKFVPLVFENEDAAKRCSDAARAHPNSTYEVRPNPPDELPWNEDEWRKRQEPV